MTQGHQKLALALTSYLASWVCWSSSPPWANPTACARHVGLTELSRLSVTYTRYTSYSSGLSETINIFRRLHGDPTLRLSFEHLQYSMGAYRVMRPVDYAADCESFSEFDAQTQHLLEVQEHRRLTLDDFRRGDWIHMVTAIGQDELVCLNYVDRDGSVTGCGDVWQGGLTAEEVICHEGKTYLKCHVDCVARLNGSNPNLQPGFCR